MMERRRGMLRASASRCRHSRMLEIAGASASNAGAVGRLASCLSRPKAAAADASSHSRHPPHLDVVRLTQLGADVVASLLQHL